MPRQIRYVADIGTALKPLVWLSLQDDGSISLGFTDRTFISPRFRARNFVFNLYNRQTLNYIIQDTPEALEPVNNPHITYHPPIYFHVRANRDEPLFEGIADVGLIMAQGEEVQWARFISRPLEELAPMADLRSGEQAEIRKIKITSPDCSIGLGIDFVPSQSVANARTPFHGDLVRWRDKRLRIFADKLPKQVSTLAWMHQH